METESILQKATEGIVAVAAAKAPHLSPRENCHEESGSLDSLQRLGKKRFESLLMVMI